MVMVNHGWLLTFNNFVIKLINCSAIRLLLSVPDALDTLPTQEDPATIMVKLGSGDNNVHVYPGTTNEIAVKLVRKILSTFFCYFLHYIYITLLQYVLHFFH